MKAINKLAILLKMGIIFMVLPITFLVLKNNLIFAGLIFIIFLSSLIYLIISIKKKKINKKFIPLGFAIGFIFLFLTVITLFITITEISKNSIIPLCGIMIPPLMGIFSILLIYYSYKSKKES